MIYNLIMRNIKGYKSNTEHEGIQLYNEEYKGIQLYNEECKEIQLYQGKLLRICFAKQNYSNSFT